MALLLHRKQRTDIVFREQAEGGAIHRLLGIGQPMSGQPKSPGSGDTPQYQRPTTAGTCLSATACSGTWAVTNSETLPLEIGTQELSWTLLQNALRGIKDRSQLGNPLPYDCTNQGRYIFGREAAATVREPPLPTPRRS